MYLGVVDVYKFVIGVGVMVVVIDIGVDVLLWVLVEFGGDFVDQVGNGLFDCDVYGIFIVFIIVGWFVFIDGFVGVVFDV